MINRIEVMLANSNETVFAGTKIVFVTQEELKELAVVASVDLIPIPMTWVQISA